jgi:cell division septation protein DedD
MGRRRLVLLVIACACAPAAAAPSTADSVRQEASRLASQGRLDEALAHVEKNAPELPAVWRAMFAGKLELEGEAAARGYTGAAADSAPDQMRGEAEFRLGQYHYAAGRYHLAIPQFRLYLARHPNGTWSQESGYWMAHACIQLVRLRPEKSAYLDTAAAYLRVLEARGRSTYYWPLARAAHARVHLLRGNTEEAALALRDARRKAPPEEMPGVLLLSLLAEPSAPEAGAWEDSLRWNYPLSPEARSLGQPVVRSAPAPQIPAPAATPASPPPRAAGGGHALQLGAFSQPDNAERLRRELTAKKIPARVEPLRTGDKTLYRVLSGNYRDAESAAREGRRLLTPKGYAFRVVKE